MTLTMRQRRNLSKYSDQELLYFSEEIKRHWHRVEEEIMLRQNGDIPYIDGRRVK